MSWLTFIFYLLKNGSFKSQPLNFEQRRQQIFKSATIKLRPVKKNIYVSLRDKLAKGKYTGTTISALAYIKNLNIIHKQYFIVDALQLSYVRIFKAGSTSMLRQLLPCIDDKLNVTSLSDKQIDELAGQYVSTRYKSYQKNYKCFTIVRNPFHRIVSVYLDLFGPNNSFFSYQAYLFGIIKKEMTFSQFVNVVSQIPDALKSMHVVSQSRVVKRAGGKDKIMCFRMESDLPALQSFLENYNLKLLQANKQTTMYDYRIYYDLSTIQLVYAMYQVDVDEFNYQKEYEALVEYVRISK